MNKMTLVIPNMPFCMGAMKTPLNPSGLPNTFPFQLEINDSLGRLEQKVDASLEQALQKVYALGNEIGTPSDNNELALPYVDDFMSFINRWAKRRGKLLEIGAGTGFMTKRLIQAGWNVTSIEPGLGYQRYWEKYDIKIINDFFPSRLVQGKYDAIVFYTVLEHIKDPLDFLKCAKRQLNPDGNIFLAVPDCTLEISASDPSILLHEHFHYFTEQSLINTLLEAGLSAKVEASQFGRSLFAVGSYANDMEKPAISSSCIQALESYVTGIPKVQEKLIGAIEQWSKLGHIGMYCPSRLLNIMPLQGNYLFYDDAIGIQGKYYPPFPYPVGSRNKLMSDSPSTVLIGSRTFGARIKYDLLSAGLSSNIVLLSDLT